MGFIVTILLGALVGWLASIVTRRDGEQGWLANIAVGIVGAFLGGFIASFFGQTSGLQFDVASMFWAFVGAVGLCVLINLFTRRSWR